ncbi:DUF1127 domain-containing protein [Parasedimentitalea maritima]|uniref:DUF1127 domain-containing protein n=1 Tax=Parasedimentitalea maritima TaxID=2578117 RepID=A0A5R8YY75_9RHOB|nr:DUF1127 domain-containing protein [Zongyanglinia marina]KAE9627360.1 DUF1127 domain-containing protein [Zongyanglinia marina]TLP58410.1 DUF1127 domain-containing protein [Zongyanglinia marina]
MAAFDTTRTTYGATGLIGRIGSTFSVVTAALVHWNEARVTRNSLSALSERELTDIGLCRGDIENIATGKF